MDKYFTIHGHPVVLKNSKQIVRRGRNHIAIKSKAALRYEQQALAQLKAQHDGSAPLRGKLSLQVTTYIACHYGAGNMPDASNLYQFPEDLLQQAGIIENDCFIEHHDGSRRICMCDNCPDRPMITKGARKGQRKDNCGDVKRCPYEQVTIVVRKDDYDE